VLGDPSREDTRGLLRAVREVYVPHRVIASVRDEADASAQGLDAALAQGRSAVRTEVRKAFVVSRHCVRRAGFDARCIARGARARGAGVERLRERLRT